MKYGRFCPQHLYCLHFIFYNVIKQEWILGFVLNLLQRYNSEICQQTYEVNYGKIINENKLESYIILGLVRIRIHDRQDPAYGVVLGCNA